MISFLGKELPHWSSSSRSKILEKTLTASLVALIHFLFHCKFEIIHFFLSFLLFLHCEAPVGGGGLLSGVCLAAKAVNPKIKIVAAEPAGADDCKRFVNPT